MISVVYRATQKHVGTTSEFARRGIYVNKQEHIEFGITLYIKRFTIDG
jgi:hypothetical protein